MPPPPLVLSSAEARALLAQLTATPADVLAHHKKSKANGDANALLRDNALERARVVLSSDVSVGDCSVLLTRSQLVTIQVKHGAIVRVEACGANENEKTHSHLAFAVARSQEEEEEEEDDDDDDGGGGVTLSPTLAHNLGLEVERLQAMGADAYVTVRPCSDEVQEASGVALRVYKLPQDARVRTLDRAASATKSTASSTDDAAEALRLHFTKADRLIAVGDVVVVDSNVEDRQTGRLFVVASVEGTSTPGTTTTFHVRHNNSTEIRLLAGAETHAHGVPAHAIHTMPVLLPELARRTARALCVHGGACVRVRRRLADVHHAASPILVHAGSTGEDHRALADAVREAARVVSLASFELDLREVVASKGGGKASQGGGRALLGAAVDAVEQLQVYAPCALILVGFEVVAARDEVDGAPAMADWWRGVVEANACGGVSIVATSRRAPIDLPWELRRGFVAEFGVDVAPNLEDRKVLLRRCFVHGSATDAAIENAALASAGLGRGALVAACADACSTAARSRKHADDDAIAKLEPALKASRAAARGALGAAGVPCVRWDAVGGLEEAKLALRQAISLPILEPERYRCARLTGVLLHGPPGTGKTLLAKAVATECQTNFISVKGPELLNMYVGESERSVRKVFERARACAPCVIFFDEVDALAPARGGGGDGSGGVLDRVVAALAAELDGAAAGGLSSGSFVVAMAATNRPDLVDPALLRAGRFERRVYVGAPQGAARAEVLRAQMRGMHLADDVDAVELAELAPARVSGADLYGVAADAWMRAAKRASAAGETQVVVHRDDFLGAMAL